jgi:hypothetical protein
MAFDFTTSNGLVFFGCEQHLELPLEAVYRGLVEKQSRLPEFGSSEIMSVMLDRRFADSVR